jgi:hypothetical protein
LTGSFVCATGAGRVETSGPRAGRPLPLTTVSLTITPPAWWGDAEYDAALAALAELDLKGELAALAGLTVGSRLALDGCRLDVRDSGDD